MNNLLASLYTALNLAIFVQREEGQFALVGNVPPWLSYFLQPASHASLYPLAELFPFLSCFLPEASQHWQAQQTQTLSSGTWLETEANGQELALEAYALWLEQQPVLLLRNLGEHYHQEVAHLQYLRENLLLQEKLEQAVQQRTLKIRQREEQIAVKLVSLTCYRDGETGAHVRRIGLYAAAMAQALGWSTEQIEQIRMAAPMHDIGKIAIPDGILLKQGPLSAAEFVIMQSHTRLGAKMLANCQIPALDMAAAIALSHHEKWDGSGYPQGLAQENIPLAARITTVVDIYDALVHKRVYKQAIQEDETLRMMAQMSGIHFDPQLFELFVELLPIMQQIRQQVIDPEEYL